MDASFSYSDTELAQMIKVQVGKYLSWHRADAG